MHTTTLPDRILFVIATGFFCAYAGTKPPRTTVSNAPAARHGQRDAAPAARYRLVGVTTNACDYTRPTAAVRNERWFAHGALEAWFRLDLSPFAFPMDNEKVSVFSVFTGGKIRPTPRDTVRELGIGAASLLALQGSSELWWGATDRGSRLITWRGFHPDADTNRLVSVQLELFPSGDYTVRSNDVAWSYARIDPNDLDGDGIPNALDACPETCDGDFFGPDGTLPPGANPRAYYTVALVAPGANAEVVFTGDGVSDHPDPHFIARSGVTYRVPLLVGKTYAIASTEPIDVFAPSDPDAEIGMRADGTFEIVRPVYVYPGNGLHAFEMCVEPDDLDGTFTWTNTCCEVVDEDDGLFIIDCNRCRCPGCTAEGFYEYEGYRIEAWGGECRGCDEDDDPPDGAGLSVPQCVFLNGDSDRETSEDDLRVLTAHLPLPRYRDESGAVTLHCTQGADRVRLWHDAGARNAAELTETYHQEGAVNLYLEGVETSEAANDVAFELCWTDNNGRAHSIVRHTTVVQVANVRVTSEVAGTSANPPPFEGQREWTFDPQNHADVDKHLVIPYRNVVNTNDFSVRDFEVDLSLEFLPSGFVPADVTAVWTRLDGTPNSGELTSVSGTSARFANPKLGGVYRFGVTCGGSPESQCTVVLPLAGADVTGVVADDLARADAFVDLHRDLLPGRDLMVILVGAVHLAWAPTANYRGRPDRTDHPTVWKYNGVDTQSGDGCVATAGGIPVRVAKLTNLLTGYVAERLGALQWQHDYGQRYGTGNDAAGQLSWDFGRQLAHTNDFATSATRFANLCWGTTRDNDKTQTLWPNNHAVDNHQPRHPFWGADYDRNFYSPRYLNGVPSAYRDAYEDMNIHTGNN